MKLKLLPKLLGLILFPSLLGLCALSWVNFHTARAALEKSMLDTQTMIGQSRQSELNGLLEVLGSVLTDFAENSGTQQLYAAFQANDPGAFEDSLALARRTVGHMARNYSQVWEAGLLSPDGKMLLHSNADLNGADMGAQPFVQVALKGESSVTTSRHPATGQISLIMSAPVVIAGKPAGVAFITVDLEHLARSTTNRVRIAQSGRAMVFDREGTLIMHPDPARMGAAMAADPQVVRLLSSSNDFFHYSREGTEFIGYKTGVPYAGWTLFVTTPTTEVLTPLVDMFRENIVVLTGIALLCGGAIFFVTRSMARSLGNTADIVQQVTEGSLELSPEQEAFLQSSSRKGDEIGKLNEGFKGMVANLRHLFHESSTKQQEAHQATQEAEKARRTAENARRDGMHAAASQLEDVTRVIAATAAELAVQAGQSRRNAVDTAERMGVTATAMAQMTATVSDVARSAATSAEISGRARVLAEQGELTVRNVVAGIQEVDLQTQNMRQDMDELDKSARNINRIIAVISDIADQTNLLAINAAIEAAKAGESGRGFAVVADEVRRLAEKTMHSATDVREVIGDIQAGAQRGSKQMESSVNAVTKATVLAGEALELLHDIVRTADANAEHARAIAAASEEQSAASGEINHSVDSASHLAAQTAEAMAQAVAAVEELHRQSQLLETIMGNMRTS